MKTLKNILLAITLAISFNSISQCKIDEITFTNNEYLEYEVYYNWGFIWVNAGKVNFNAKDTIINNTPLWKFVSIGTSYKNYDWIFKLRDHYESLAYKKNLTPLYYHRNTREGGLYTNNKYIFNKKKRKIYSNTYNSDNGAKNDTLDFENCIFDVLSATYYIRSINISNKKINDTIPLTTIMDGEKTRIVATYLGKEKIIHKNGKEYNTIKYSTSVAKGSVFKGDEEIFVWVINNKNKVPVLIKANIMVGSVKVYLSETKNLKYDD